MTVWLYTPIRIHFELVCISYQILKAWHLHIITDFFWNVNSSGAEGSLLLSLTYLSLFKEYLANSLCWVKVLGWFLILFFSPPNLPSLSFQYPNHIKFTNLESESFTISSSLHCLPSVFICTGISYPTESKDPRENVSFLPHHCHATLYVWSQLVVSCQYIYLFLVLFPQR